MHIGAAEGSSVNVRAKWQPFVNGEFIEGTTERVLYDPGTGKELCTVQELNESAAETAIAAARRAFDEGPWPRMSPAARAKTIRRIADLLERRMEEFAVLETLNSGKPLREARFDVTDSVNCLRYHAGLISVPMGQTVDVPAPSRTQIVREPIGVCGQIIPWNYPLQMAVWKLAPALITGNTCVLKPSEITPLTALLLSELIQEAEVPPGVVNIVTGDGASVGMPLASSSLVDKIAFTGSGRTGRLVAAAALGNLKKVTLELGGKSPMIVFGDVNIDTAVDYAMYAIYCHAGQVCSAGSRFIVERSVYDEFLSRFIARTKQIRVGPGMDETTEMGPLVSEMQLGRVMDYIETGMREGATLETGGDRLAGGRFANGYFVSPTIFSTTGPTMRIVQEEIFGPVAVVESFDTETEALELANGSIYGLAGAVFTNDATRAYRVSKAIKAGVIWINGYHSCYNECPFGGYKQSGWGRECGTFGVEAYTEVKQINLNLEPSPIRWFRK